MQVIKIVMKSEPSGTSHYQNTTIWSELFTARSSILCLVLYRCRGTSVRRNGSFWCDFRCWALPQRGPCEGQGPLPVAFSMIKKSSMLRWPRWLLRSCTHPAC